MQLKITIADDAELRNFIKDMIRGTITEIVRQDVKTMVEEFVNNKLDAAVESTVKPLVQLAVNNSMYRNNLQSTIHAVLAASINKEAIAYIREQILVDFRNLVEGKRDGPKSGS